MLHQRNARTESRFVLILNALAWSMLLPMSVGNCQVVQLPTTGTFSLDTTVLVPDSGSAFLGGSRNQSMGTRSLGPGSSAYGGSSSAGGATVHATIIDLNELDEMIRSQSSSIPGKPNISPGQPKASQYPSGSKGKPTQNAEYDYLAALSHPNTTHSQQSTSDTNYYLALANNAKRNRHWASVELYYKLAWDSLPESRKKSVLKTLEEARNTKIDEKSSRESKPK